MRDLEFVTCYISRLFAITNLPRGHRWLCFHRRTHRTTPQIRQGNRALQRQHIHLSDFYHDQVLVSGLARLRILLGHLCIRSYETVVKRWPVILTTVIDSVYSENHELTGVPDKTDKLEEGKALIATISRLKYGMARDRALEYVVSRYLLEADARIALPQAYSS